MQKPERVKVRNASDMGRSVEALIADGRPRLLEKDGEVVALIVRPNDAALTYDAAGLREAYNRAPVLFSDPHERKQFLEEIHAAREQAPRAWEQHPDHADGR